MLTFCWLFLGFQNQGTGFHCVSASFHSATATQIVQSVPQLQVFSVFHFQLLWPIQNVQTNCPVSSTTASAPCAVAHIWIKNVTKSLDLELERKFFLCSFHSDFSFISVSLGNSKPAGIMVYRPIIVTFFFPRVVWSSLQLHLKVINLKLSN